MDGTPIKTIIEPVRRDDFTDLTPGLRTTVLPPQEFETTVIFYEGGEIIEVTGRATAIQVERRMASHLDELLAADMREVWQRDLQRRRQAGEL